MALAGFDRLLLARRSEHTQRTHPRCRRSFLEKDISDVVSGGTNLARKMREDKIRAALILGENPAASEDYNSFVNNLEFLVVADMFLTETAQAADVFLPSRRIGKPRAISRTGRVCGRKPAP
jgi:anaerobic selenocysteine-containing dehydrogenase